MDIFDSLEKLIDSGASVETLKQQIALAREKYTAIEMIVNCSMNAIISMDSSGRIIGWSMSAERLFGYSKEYALGQNLNDLIIPSKYHDAHVKGFKKYLNSGQDFQSRIYMNAMRQDKTEVPVELSISVISTGKETFFSAFVADITDRVRAQNALSESESRYRLLVENSPICIHEIDMDGKITSMNKAGLDMMAVREESNVCGLLYLEAVEKSDRKRIGELLARAYSGETSHFEFAASGEKTQIFKSCFVPIKNKNGVVEKLMGLTEDITARKFLELEMAQSISVLQAVFDTTTEGILVSDRLGNITTFNQRFAQLWQIPSGLLTIGGDQSAALLFLCDLMEKPDFFIDRVRQLSTNLEAISRDNFYFKDGSIFECYSIPQRIQDQIVGRIWSFRDVTERIQSEEILMHYQAIVENSDDAIVGKNSEGIIISWNNGAVQMFGYRREEALGRNISTLIPEGFLNEEAMIMEKISNGIPLKNFDTVRRHKDGHLVDISVSISPLRDHNGKIVGASKIARDITERKSIETKLQELNRDFIAFLENTSDFIYFKDVEGRFHFCSQTLANITGHDSWRDMIGKNDSQVFQKDMAEIYSQEELSIFRDGKPLLNRIDPFYDEYGNKGWVSTNKWPLFEKEGTNVVGIYGISRDITILKKSEEARDEALDRIQKIASRVPGVVYEFRLRPDGSSCIPFASEAIREIFRVSPEDVKEDTSKAFSMIHPEDYEGVMTSIQTSAVELSAWHYEFRIKYDDDTIRWLLGNAMPQPEADGSILWYGFLTDNTYWHEMEDMIRQLGFYDVLTKLPNRRLMLDRLGQTMSSSKRTGRFGAVMYLDLDNFKPLNDKYGHDVGDLLLIEVAHRIKGCVREVDTVSRFGGDEFVVMIGDLEQEEGASISQVSKVAEKIRQVLAQPYILAHRQNGFPDCIVEHHCSSSIGVVMLMNHESTPEDVLKWADIAMYQAKNAGRNTISFYNQT